MAVDFSRGQGSLEDIERARALAERQRARDAELDSIGVELIKTAETAASERATEAQIETPSGSPAGAEGEREEQLETGSRRGKELVDSITRTAQAQRARARADRQR